MTLYGACIGTMIVMTDFMVALPVMTGSLEMKRYVMQAILTVVAIILCMLKDPSLLVKISSFGLVALAVSFVLLFFYGVRHYHFSFDASYLWPTFTRYDSKLSQSRFVRQKIYASRAAVAATTTRSIWYLSISSFTSCSFARFVASETSSRVSTRFPTVTPACTLSVNSSHAWMS